jgi:anti-sigma B factor antagonist
VVELTIEVRREGDANVLALAGEFDMAVVDKFENELATVEESGAEVIVADLSDVEFMDSSGLRALVIADQRARKAGRRFAIVPGPPPVRRVFELTQLEGRLDFVESASDLS